MRKKENSLVLGIIVCFIIGTMLFTFQYCKRDRSGADRLDSLGISYEDIAPSWSPDGKKIVYYSYRDGNLEICSMNPDGSGQTRLTENNFSYITYAVKSSWSSDGARIVFDSTRDGNREIYVMNKDGSSQTRLTDNPAVDGMPSWSPDGTRIAFTSNRDGNWEIYAMNADGSNQTRLTDNPARESYPSWSPDGTRIVYDSTIGGTRIGYVDRNSEIYVMNADGSNQIKLTETPFGDGMPSWSPDGTQIAFVSGRDGNREIYVMNADGSNQIRLTDNPAHERFPSWSPDGQKITFVSGRDYDEEVYVMDADGSNPVNLTNNAPVNEAYGTVPLPQSELNLDEIPYKIVYESFRETDGKENWEICLINADGSNLINLTNTPEIDEMYPHASPDGRSICFVAVEGEDLVSKSSNVYAMKIDGTGRIKIAENAHWPCWDPGGMHIAYALGEFPRYDPSMRAYKGLEIYNLETGEAKRHYNEKMQRLHCLCWSPDGKWFMVPEIAYKADDNTIINLSIEGCTPDISPDGKLLIWNGDDWNLIVGTLDFDSPQSSVTDHRTVVACDHNYWIYHGDWSPDGNYLTFTYGKEGANIVGRPAPGANICICDLSTGKWTQVTTDGKHNKEPDWVPVRVR